MKPKKNKIRAQQSDNRKDPEAGSSPSFPATLLHYIRKYDFLILFIVLYLAYNTVDGVSLTSGDTTPSSLLPLGMLANHNMFLDFATSYITNPDFSYAFLHVNGHYVSFFPVVTPVLALPVYAVSGFLSTFMGNPYGNIAFFILAKSAASFITALAGVFVYLSAKELFSEKIAIITTFIFAFATSTWSISSQALWQQGTVEMLLAALIWLMLKDGKAESRVYVLLMGILSGLFFFNRPPDALLLIPVIFYCAWLRRKSIHYYLAGGLLGGLPFLWYNYAIFGNFFGGYTENLSRFTGTGAAGHFLGLLFSPNAGLFTFCPVLLLGIAGIYVIYTGKESPVRTLLLVSGLAVFLEILLYSFWVTLSSSAAYTFGPRYLTCLVPLLCLYTGFFLEDWFGAGKKTHQGPAQWFALTIVGVLILLSVFIQFTGVFFYGYSSDANLNMTEERTWSATDSVIIRSVTEGSTRVPGISVYLLPPLPPLFQYDFPGKSNG
jgi:hypothetical protein